MTLPFTYSQINSFPNPVGPFQCAQGSQVAIYATGFGGDVGRASGFNEQHAQAILTPSGGMTVATVKLQLIRVGAPGDSVQIEIRQGSATGTIVGTSTGLLGSTIPTSSSVQTLTFTTPVVLAGSTTYFFIVRRSGSADSSNHYRITYGTGGNYTGGNLWAKVSGGGWTENASYDLNIAISDGTPTYFMIARDLSDALMLVVMKATDPSEDWGMWPTAPQAGFVAQIINVSACKSGDTIHLGILEGTTNSYNLKYHTYDMAFERWIINETVQSAFNPQPLSFLYGGPGVSIAFRTSDNQPVIYFSGAQVSNMGSAYARTYYRRRTAAATWAAAVLVDIGGLGDWVVPKVLRGANNVLHFFAPGTSPAASYHRSLSTANVLDTAVMLASGISGVQQRSAVTADGHVYVIASDLRNAAFTSGANPTITQLQTATHGNPTQIYAIGNTFYSAYRDS
ncbi:MAG TPA: choice-of-anchor R domain-containing protein, partial [Vicinamibacterales bacterium]